jgi:anti-anti-sigma factor
MSHGAYAGRVQPVDWPQSAWDGHLLLAYVSEQDRRSGVAAWVRRGLELGAKILYVERPDVPLDRSLTAVLSERKVDSVPAMGVGQLQVVDSVREAVDPAWQASVVDEALVAGYPTVRLSGEASTVWTVTSPLEHLQVERAADTLCRTRPVSMMCQYAAREASSTLQEACAVHSAGLRESLLHTVPTPDGVAVAGEVDSSNEGILRSALAGACADLLEGLGAFVVDLSRLRFLDVSGARALLTATADHRRRGGVVRLLAPQPAVDRLLRLLDLDRVDGFILEGA